MSLETNTVLLIVLVGLATYATRIAGYWLLRDVKITGRTKAALDAVPPAVLVAVIAPKVLMSGLPENTSGANALALVLHVGWPEKIAGAVTIVAALMRLPLLVVIIIGVAAAALMRQFI